MNRTPREVAEELVATHGSEAWRVAGNLEIRADSDGLKSRADFYRRVAAYVRRIGHERARAPIRAGTFPDLARAAWRVSLGGSRGRDALAVLQDALQEHYGPALDKAIRKAKLRQRRNMHAGPQTVVFGPSMERGVRQNLGEGTQRFYAEHHWPFRVEPRPDLHARPTAVVVWDTKSGWDVGHWADRRRVRPMPETEPNRPCAQCTSLSFDRGDGRCERHGRRIVYARDKRRSRR